jgi:hypothetical protein
VTREQMYRLMDLATRIGSAKDAHDHDLADELRAQREQLRSEPGFMADRDEQKAGAV